MSKRFWLVLISAIVACHAIFQARYLYDWDAVQFALALERFDILNHQPHPPGYILLVGLARLLNFFFNDANQTYLFINLVCHVLSAILVFTLGRNLFDEPVGKASACIFSFSPIVLFSCNITSAYGAECLAALSIAWSVERSVRKARARDFILATFIFGIAGGVRQNLLVLMFPLWAWGLWNLRQQQHLSHRATLGLFGFLGLVVMAWMVPLVHDTGTWVQYQKATSDLLVFLFHDTSIFYGISLAKFLEMLGRLLGWLFILGLSVATLPLFILLGKRFSLIFSKDLWRERRSQFLILWIAPAFIFYGLFHLPKPGYLLTYLGAFTILAGFALRSFAPTISLSVKTAVVSVLLLSHFTFSGPLMRWLTHGSNETFQLAVFGLGGKYSYEAIRIRDRYFENLISYIRSHFNPNDTVLISESWPKKHPPIRRWLRHAMVYLPEYYFLEISTPPLEAPQSVFQTLGKKPLGKPFFEHEYDGMLKVRKENPTPTQVPEQRLTFTQQKFLLMDEDFRDSLPDSGWSEYKTSEGHQLFSLTLKPGQSFTYGKVTLERKL